MTFPNQQPFRPDPKMPTQAYKTYRIMQPLSTHFRMATCAEVQCEAYKNGWTYKKSDLEAQNLLYVVTHAGKRYREVVLPPGEWVEGKFIRDPNGVAETYLAFEPGQSCFQESTHRKSLERPEFYYAGRGDYRSFSTRRAQQFVRPEDWRDSFAEHLDVIHTAIERG